MGLETVDYCTSPEEMEERLEENKFDIILCAGWSWIIPDDIVENNLVVGIHPSDLPDYAGGSPLQHQILDGMTETQCTLFRLSKKLDGGEILDKEPMSLEGGNMSVVFKELTRVSLALVRRLLKNFPDIETKPNNVTKVRKRYKPKHSNLGTKMGDWLLSECSVEEIYNFIRCKTDPYPNAFLKDKTGTLYFERVRFEPNKD
jgi:methionyl-tRNA formyltransferase